MLITHLHRFLTAPTTKTSRSQVVFWFSLSLTFSAIYAILGLQQAFSGEYVIADDAREHVFWMQRFLDTELFPKDYIADYFQSVAPAGYTALYQWMTYLGINPLLLHKLLPPVLGLLTTGYCFGVCMEILPVPIAGFIATLLLNQSLWMTDDLASATPRAFLYPLFVVFMYYLLRRSLLPCAVAIALLGLFYPQCVFICAGVLILRLLRLEDGRLRLSPDRQDYWLCATGLGVSLLVLLPYALTPNKFGPAYTAAQAKQIPDFWKGKSAVFQRDLWRFFITGKRTGMFGLPVFTPPTLWLGLLLPLLLRFGSKFPLYRYLTPSLMLLPQIILASIGMFFAAHALLFKLHLPSRYTSYTFRLLLTIATGIALTLLLDAVLGWLRQHGKNRFSRPQLLAMGTTLLIGAGLVFYPSFVKNFPLAGYVVGRVPPLYEFFAQQPKDILIASLSEEANNLPTFSRRSILMGREYYIPYHKGYYQQIRQRFFELIRAQYSQNLAEAQNLIRQYGVDFWLLDREWSTAQYLHNNGWFRRFQLIKEEVAALQQGKVPALLGVVEQCTVFQTKDLVVLQADCIVKASPK
jgi:hypothetical protein